MISSSAAMSREGFKTAPVCCRRRPSSLKQKSAGRSNGRAPPCTEAALRKFLVTGALSDRERDRFATLGRVYDAHVDALAFGQMGHAGGAEDRDMDEDLLAAVVAGDKTGAPRVVEPFDLARDADRRRRVRPNPPRARRIA